MPTTTENTYCPPWLERYATNYHAWKPDTLNGKQIFRRPLGLVETTFDTDGAEYGGRADMNALLTLEIKHVLSKEELRERITMAWADLRLQHVMLMSRVYKSEEKGTNEFIIDVEKSYESVVEEAEKSIGWIEDHYTSVNSSELYKHCLNVGRIIDPEQCMSKLHVLPLVALPNGHYKLDFLIIMAHETSDGLSAHNWFSHFLSILNTPLSSIRSSITTSMTPQSIKSRLPPAQEDLYPRVPGNKARQRWFWAILRVLRHKHKSLPPTFSNPLWRPQPLEKPIPYPPTYSKIFDYTPSKQPPLNCGHINASLSPTASQRLIHLCRSSNLSIGAGCFALAGLAMMELHEQRFPNMREGERQAFTASFPLNPRAFFGFTTPADSCMLAFSEGIVMPFLPSSLPIEGRFKLTAAHANRELKVYQKRAKGKKGAEAGKGEKEVDMSLAPHSPGRLLAGGYLWQIERNATKLPPHKRDGSVTPQGSLAAHMSEFGATCGVSSMGSTAGVFRAGMFDLNDVGDGKKDFAADYRGLKIGVRARDGEFLVGSSTDYRGIVGFGVSYDGNAISEEAAEEWAEKIGGLLEVEGEKSRL